MAHVSGLQFAIAGIFLLGLAGNAPAADVDSLDAKRAAFRAAWPEVERGNWEALREHEQLLGDYVLWPDLRARYLRARIEYAEHDEIRAFLDRYGMLKPARELRYQFALHLADAGHHAEYLQIYRTWYADLGVAKLDCLALQAELATGRQDTVVERALDLWLVGQSQDDACDPVFSRLRSAGILTTPYYEKRFALAVEERRLSLAHYLAKSLDDSRHEQADAWLEARDGSLEFLRTREVLASDDVGRAQIAYAIERVAYDDPLLAADIWRRMQATHRFSVGQRRDIDRHISLWAARRQLPEAQELLQRLPADATDDEVRRWMIRSGLRRQDWQSVLRAIALLPDEQQNVEEWRYWEAIALRYSGQNEPAAAKLNALADTRSYYGFLASDALGREYEFADSRLVPDAAIAARILAMPAIERARELYYVGLDGQGRSEWDAAVRELAPDEQAQAAILAHRWGWHSRAIATASGIGEFDDLEIRYPLPWREEFANYSRTANIDDSLAYGIARSESLFMRDVRSQAGAVGVMQILPETGRRIARDISYPYSGSATLTDSSSSIRLGTIYLRQLFDRFADNRVLATAAYNAGPLNVEAWLPAGERLDARIWIENIPYDETRDYVRRVLTADTIFHWRLTGRIRRLTTELMPIGPSSETVAQSIETHQ